MAKNNSDVDEKVEDRRSPDAGSERSQSPAGRGKKRSHSRDRRSVRSRSPKERRRSRSRSPPRKRRQSGQGPLSLLVRNLSRDLSTDDIRHEFKSFGDIKDAYMPLDHSTRMPRGYAFVEFYEASDAENAMKEMNGKKIDGRAIEVVQAKQRRKSPHEMRKIYGNERSSRGGDYRRSRRRSRSRSRGYRRSYSRDRRSFSRERRHRSRSRDHRRRRRSRSYSR